MFFGTDSPADSQVNESNQPQDETNNAPVQDDSPAEGSEEEADEQPQQTTKRPAERTVPVSALIQERRRYQSTISEIRRELDELKRGSTKRTADPADESEYDRQRRTWQKQLGVTELQEKLDELSEAIETIHEKVGRVDHLSHGANLAVRQYIGGVEQHANSQYEDTLPITKDQFERLVAAEITQEEADEIFRGNYRAIDGAVKRVKQAFRQPSPGTNRKAAEANRLRNLPKTPAKGGTPPKANKEEPAFTSLRDLHNQAWDDFQAKRNQQE